MNDDPLTSMLERSLGVRVSGVRSEIVTKNADLELERVRFIADGEPRSLVFQRVPKDRALEVRLLPLLARKSEHVPKVHARGIPPPLVPAWPWLLLEDLLDAPGGCDDAQGVLRAKRAIEIAVAADGPALRAAGVPGKGSVLVHGDLRCANAMRVARGVVLTGWSHAHLGESVEDEASLTLDLPSRPDGRSES